ncbi:MAG TPA: 2-hydroxyacid dehydrogenase [Chloroflexota bacterium]|nr:2-hydroxyacid dehydrogenase [Chloroflexota bacterium]
MSRPRIVYAPPPAADVLAIAEGLLPPGYDFQVVDSGAVPDALGGADYLMGFIGRLPPGVLGDASRLRLVQLMSVGYDTFDLQGARAAGVPVAVNGGANAIAVAEHAVMLMLATLKRLVELNSAVHGGQWRSGPSGEERLYELWHSTVGIVGLGRIGRQVAQRLRGWEATLRYFDPVRLPAAEEQALGVEYRPLEQLLAESDVVTVHVPLSDQTRHLIDARALSLMKPSAVLVNTSRGGLVDEAALAEALRTGGILGAGLDVLSAEPPPADHPLLPLPNAVLTPHVAGPTWQSWPRRFTNCFANIDRVNRGDAPQWVVPELADLPPRPVPSPQR